MNASVSSSQRFTRLHRCPVCGGCDQDPRGQGKRCGGYLSSDGQYAHCGREEHAGPLDLESNGTTYAHRISGSCNCGTSHGPDRYPPRAEAEAVYEYFDEDGALVYQVVRKPGKAFRQRVPDGCGGWIWKLNGARRVLYRLPELIAATAGPVYIVEGEKDADTLRARGLVATTSAQGAKSWGLTADNARTVLRGRDVVVIRDRDAEGLGYALAIESSLTGVARSLRFLECTRGKDITDHLSAGGTMEELVEMDRATQPQTPKPRPAPATRPAPSHPDNDVDRDGFDEDHPSDGAPEQPAPESERPDEQSAPRVRVDEDSTYTWRRGDHVELGERLIAVLQGSGQELVFDDGALHKYAETSGRWEPVTDAQQSRVLQRFAGSPIHNPVTQQSRALKIKASDVTGARKLAADRASDPGFFSTAPSGLMFANGFVEVRADGIRLRDHSHENRARFGYDFDYSSGSRPERFLKYLADVFRDDEDQAQKLDFVQEFLGVCLIGQATKFQQSVICIGDGSDGKSQLLDIFDGVFPRDAVCSIAPHDFECQYRRALLAGKRINIVNELPDAEIDALEKFKAIVVGNPCDARVINQMAFTLRPVAGHLFACNALPGTADQSLGFWRRWVVLEFNRNFQDDPERVFDIGKAIVEKERAAIVAWGLEGARRMMQPKAKYTVPSSNTGRLLEWRRQANPVAMWHEERTSKEPGTTRASVAYEDFAAWSRLNGHKQLSNIKFGMRLRQLGFGSREDKNGNVYPFAMKAVR
ncbi:MAG: phage/plasmid primase, P4 family [Polyangiaceae bacterium]